MKILLELPYWPPVGWTALLWSAEQAELEANEHFQKGTYRNRCHLAGPNGLQRLSIPLLKGKNSRQPIRDTRIAYYEPWQRLHWRTITANYGNAPFFEHYADELATFYTKNYTFLFDLNLEILQFVLKTLRRPEMPGLSETFRPPEPRVDTDFRDSFDPRYPEKFPEWFNAAAYLQVFQEKFGFLPNLSVLDLLLCYGPHAATVLTASIRKI